MEKKQHLHKTIKVESNSPFYVNRALKPPIIESPRCLRTPRHTLAHRNAQTHRDIYNQQNSSTPDHNIRTYLWNRWDCEQFRIKLRNLIQQYLSSLESSKIEKHKYVQKSRAEQTQLILKAIKQKLLKNKEIVKEIKRAAENGKQLKEQRSGRDHFEIRVKEQQKKEGNKSREDMCLSTLTSFFFRNPQKGNSEGYHRRNQESVQNEQQSVDYLQGNQTALDSIIDVLGGPVYLTKHFLQFPISNLSEQLLFGNSNAQDFGSSLLRTKKNLRGQRTSINLLPFAVDQSEQQNCFRSGLRTGNNEFSIYPKTNEQSNKNTQKNSKAASNQKNNSWKNNSQKHNKDWRADRNVPAKENLPNGSSSHQFGDQSSKKANNSQQNSKSKNYSRKGVTENKSDQLAPKKQSSGLENQSFRQRGQGSKSNQNSLASKNAPFQGEDQKKLMASGVYNKKIEKSRDSFKQKSKQKNNKGSDNKKNQTGRKSKQKNGYKIGMSHHHKNIGRPPRVELNKTNIHPEKLKNFHRIKTRQTFLRKKYRKRLTFRHDETNESIEKVDESKKAAAQPIEVEDHSQSISTQSYQKKAKLTKYEEARLLYNMRSVEARDKNSNKAKSSSNQNRQQKTRISLNNYLVPMEQQSSRKVRRASYTRRTRDFEQQNFLELKVEPIFISQSLPSGVKLKQQQIPAGSRQGLEIDQKELQILKFNQFQLQTVKNNITLHLQKFKHDRKAKQLYNFLLFMEESLKTVIEQKQNTYSLDPIKLGKQKQEISGLLDSIEPKVDDYEGTGKLYDHQCYEKDKLRVQKKFIDKLNSRVFDLMHWSKDEKKQMQYVLGQASLKEIRNVNV